MDTENFVLERSRIVERLDRRRSQDLTSFPFQFLGRAGIRFPAWARLAMSFISKESVISRFLEVGIPLAAPLLFRHKMPFVNKLVQSLFSRKS